MRAAGCGRDIAVYRYGTYHRSMSARTYTKYCVRLAYAQMDDKNNVIADPDYKKLGY